MGFFDSLFGKKKEEAKSKKICPVCGTEFSDKGMDVNDGTICSSCWDLVLDDFESGKMDFCKHIYHRIATKARIVGNPVSKIELLDDNR